MRNNSQPSPRPGRLWKAAQDLLVSPSILSSVESSRSLLMRVAVCAFMAIAGLGFTETAAQDLMIKGVVKDETGVGMPGATVVVQGTSTGTVTDLNGAFSIEAPRGSTLIISFTGYGSQEFVVNDATPLNVTLTPETVMLQELVVVGYGAQRREAVTGSVASLGGEMLREVPSSNVSQALQGRLPGVEISQVNTKPGASTQIRIRGSRSLTASNDPLIVLDGIPFAGSFADINPGDVKSIDILKDASATAIYGSRGANGVILISTYKGQKGQKARVSYNSFIGAKEVFSKYPMMDGPEFVALRKAAGLYSNGVDENDAVNFDWQDALYRTGIYSNQNLSITSGTERGSYNFGFGYNKEEAVLPGQEFERFSLNGSIDQEVGELFRFGINTYTSYTRSLGNSFDLYQNLSTTPIADPYNADGTLKRTVRMALDENWVRTRETMEGLGDSWIDLGKNFGSTNNLYGEVKIPGIEGLKYRLNAGLNYRISTGGGYTGEGVFSVNPTTLSSASINNSLFTSWVLENVVTYDRIFAGKHNLNLTALYSAQEDRFNSSSASARDIPSDAFQFYNLGQALGEATLGQGNFNESGLISYMGRVMYSYNGRYMLTATVRSDASSRLAKGNQWHTYPAVSAGWNISEEPFMQGVNVINRLKLRAGWGQTSNQAINPYATLGALGTRNYNFGSSFVTGYLVTQLPNTNLGWEFSNTANVGLDFDLFNNRLSGTVEYYVTNTKDILLSVGLPSTSGVSSYTANIGETKNTGVEVSLNGVIVRSNSGLTWEAGINVYSNKNELVALASGQTRNEGNAWFVGHPINVIFDYEKIGLWQSEDPFLTVYEPGGNVGMIKVKYTGGFNADGSPVRRIGPDDRQIIDVNPDFQGGFNTRLTYKGFDLSAVGVFQSGGTLVSTLYGSAGYLNLMTGRRNNVKIDYWTPENPDAKYPKPGGLASGDNPKYGSTLGYFDATYLKVRSITLGYDLKHALLKSSSLVNRMRVYAVVENPFVLFSPYYKESKMDPETNSYGNQNQAVASYQSRILVIGTNTPTTRNFILGLNVTF